MADEQGKQQVESSKDILKQLKERLDVEGDYLDLLKNVNRELKRSSFAYERINVRLQGLLKDTINTKAIQREIVKSSRQLYLSQKRVADLEKSISNETKMLLVSKDAMEKKEKEIQEQLKQQVSQTHKKRLEQQLSLLQTKKENTENILRTKTELDALEYAKAQLKLSEKNHTVIEKELETEKLVSRQLGVSGNLVGAISKKLGIGQEVHEDMVLAARDMVDENGKVVSGFQMMGAGAKSIYKNLTSSISSMSVMTKVAGVAGLAIMAISAAADALGKGMSKAGSIIKGLSDDSSDFFSNAIAPINGMLTKIPIVGGLLSGVVSFWTSILDLVIGVEDRIVKAGRQLGLSASQASKLNDQFAAAARSSEKIYLNSKALMDSQLELTSLTGLNNIASEKNLETNIELAKFAGVEADARGKIYEASILTGKSSKEIAENILGQVSNLRKATGIAFNYQSIIKEAASQSGRLGLMFTKYPQQLTKSLITVKALGLELKDLESIGDSMLDFESSISKEFEAQLLLGKEINLNKAREAFLNNDLTTAAMEITKYTGDANGFLKLNRIQQQSLAEVMGMSVDSLSDFLKKQEVLVKLNAKDNKELMEKVRLSQANNAEKDKMIGLLGEEEYRNLINLSSQEKLMESFNKIKQSLVDFLTRNNVLEKIQYYINKFTNPENIEGIVQKLKSLMSTIFDFVSKVTSTILDAVDNVVDFFVVGDNQKAWDLKMKSAKQAFSDISKEINNSLKDVAPVKAEAAKKEASATESEATKPRRAEKSVGDAVIFPNSNMVINKDPLDYTIFTKNPAALSAPMDKDSIKQIVSEAVSAVVKERPIIVNTHTNLSLDGQVAAKSTVNSMKNNPLIGFDRTFGQMALNS